MPKPPGREHRNVCLNRKARFAYELEETYEAGLILRGSEVKSLRQGRGNLEDAWVGFDDRGRPVLMGAHIAPYPQANLMNHEPTRPRPMLMHLEELGRLRQRVKEKGLALVPTQMYFLGPWIKVEFAVGRGKKLHDKRATIREREDSREAQRAIRGR